MRYPLTLDLRKATLAEHPNNHVVRDADDNIVALCPIDFENPPYFPGKQFSLGPRIVRALNALAQLEREPV